MLAQVQRLVGQNAAEPSQRALKTLEDFPTSKWPGSFAALAQPLPKIAWDRTVSLACCDHRHRSFCQFRRTTWTLLLVVSLLLLRDFGTLFHWTVELLHPLTHLSSVLRHFSLIRHNRTVARASVLWRDINWLTDWLIDRLGLSMLFTVVHFAEEVEASYFLLILQFCIQVFCYG